MSIYIGDTSKKAGKREVKEDGGTITKDEEEVVQEMLTKDRILAILKQLKEMYIDLLKEMSKQETKEMLQQVKTNLDREEKSKQGAMLKELKKMEMILDVGEMSKQDGTKKMLKLLTKINFNLDKMSSQGAIEQLTKMKLALEKMSTQDGTKVMPEQLTKMNLDLEKMAVLEQLTKMNLELKNISSQDGAKAMLEEIRKILILDLEKISNQCKTNVMLEQLKNMIVDGENKSSQDETNRMLEKLKTMTLALKNNANQDERKAMLEELKTMNLELDKMSNEDRTKAKLEQLRKMNLELEEMSKQDGTKAMLEQLTTMILTLEKFINLNRKVLQLTPEPKVYSLSGIDISVENSTIYRAAILNEWNTVENIFRDDEKKLKLKLSPSGDTALHIAVGTNKSHEFVEKIVDELLGKNNNVQALRIKNNSGDTALHVAAWVGNKRAAKHLVDKDRGMLKVTNKKNHVPLRVAGWGNDADTLHNLYTETLIGNPPEEALELDINDGIEFLFICIKSGHYDVALWIIERYPILVWKDTKGKEGAPLKSLASKPDAFRSGMTSGYIKEIIYTFGSVNDKSSTKELPEKTAEDSDSTSLVVPFGDRVVPSAVWEFLWWILNHLRHCCLPLVQFCCCRCCRKDKIPTTRATKEGTGDEESGQTTRNGVDEDSGKTPSTSQKEKKKRRSVGKKAGNAKSSWKTKSVYILDYVPWLVVQFLILIAKFTKYFCILVPIYLFLMLLNFLHECFRWIFYVFYIHYNPEYVKEVKDEKLRHKHAQQLVTKICSKLLEVKDEYNDINVYDDVLGPAICTAIKNGCIELIKKCIEKYPGTIWCTYPEGSFIGLAIKYRQEEVFNLINQMSAFKIHALNHREKLQNALHFAGELPPYHRLSIVTGPALQMQRELLWFQEVEKMVETSSIHYRNIDNLTPREVFTKEHQKLVIDAGEWTKATSASSTVVAALIVTITFAAMFTVPGGLKSGGHTPGEPEGIPEFINKKLFLVFAFTDSAALFFSAISVLSFLSTLTCLTQEDFLSKVPWRLTFGFVSLFLSLVATIFAFGATLVLMLQTKVHWIWYMAIPVGSFPIILYICWQHSLLRELFWGTVGVKFGKGIFHKHKDGVLIH